MAPFLSLSPWSLVTSALILSQMVNTVSIHALSLFFQRDREV